MKKNVRRSITLLLLAIMLVGVNVPVAKAEEVAVVIHARDDAGWGNVNVFNWGDAGETAGAWPGSTMEAEEEDWYTYTLYTECDLNLVFCTTLGTPQSNDIGGLSMDSGEIWVVISGAGEENDWGVSGAAATLYAEAEEGWPIASATSEVAVTEAEEAIPKTGEAKTVLPIILFGLMCLSVTAIVYIKRRERTQ